MNFYKFKNPHGDEVRIDLNRIVSYTSFGTFIEINFGNSTLTVDCTLEKMDDIFSSYFVN